ARPPPPWPAFFHELRAVIPPLTLVHLALAGAGVWGVVRNLLTAAAIALVAALLIRVLGTPAQWIALGVGLYAALSWLQALALRDRPTHRLITRTPTLRWATIGFALLAFVGYGVGFWLPPCFMRRFGPPPGETGLILGLTSATGGWLGTTLGGLWADRRRLRRPDGRLQVGVACPLLAIPLAVWMLGTDSSVLAFVLVFPLTVCSSLWIGPGASTIQDLVLPRMRGSASAAYLLVVTFVGLALGPYTVGRLSVGLGDLRSALLCALIASATGGAFLLVAARHIARDESSRLERARAAGEPGWPPARRGPHQGDQRDDGHHQAYDLVAAEGLLEEDGPDRSQQQDHRHRVQHADGRELQVLHHEDPAEGRGGVDREADVEVWRPERVLLVAGELQEVVAQDAQQAETDGDEHRERLADVHGGNRRAVRRTFYATRAGASTAQSRRSVCPLSREVRMFPDAADLRRRACEAFHRRRRAAHLRALRAVPVRLPHLRRAGDRGRFASRPHPSHASARGGASRAIAGGRPAPGPLPRVSRLRDCVPVGRALRAAGRGGAAV